MDPVCRRAQRTTLRASAGYSRRSRYAHLSVCRKNWVHHHVLVRRESTWYRCPNLHSTWFRDIPASMPRSRTVVSDPPERSADTAPPCSSVHGRQPHRRLVRLESVLERGPWRTTSSYCERRRSAPWSTFSFSLPPRCSPRHFQFSTHRSARIHRHLRRGGAR